MFHLLSEDVVLYITQYYCFHSLFLINKTINYFLNKIKKNYIKIVCVNKTLIYYFKLNSFVYQCRYHRQNYIVQSLTDIHFKYLTNTDLLLICDDNDKLISYIRFNKMFYQKPTISMNNIQKQIKLVVEQTACLHITAFYALLESNLDIVLAILAVWRMSGV